MGFSQTSTRLFEEGFEEAVVVGEFRTVETEVAQCTQFRLLDPKRNSIYAEHEKLILGGGSARRPVMSSHLFNAFH